MLAKQCDRCGSFYLNYTSGECKKLNLDFNGVTTKIFGIGGDEILVREDYDLCKECSRKLKDFLENKTESDIDEVSDM